MWLMKACSASRAPCWHCSEAHRQRSSAEVRPLFANPHLRRGMLYYACACAHDFATSLMSLTSFLHTVEKAGGVRAANVVLANHLEVPDVLEAGIALLVRRGAIKIRSEVGRCAPKRRAIDAAADVAADCVCQIAGVHVFGPGRLADNHLLRCSAVRCRCAAPRTSDLPFGCRKDLAPRQTCLSDWSADNPQVPSASTRSTPASHTKRCLCSLPSPCPSSIVPGSSLRAHTRRSSLW